MTTTQKNDSAKSPTHIAYHVRDNRGKGFFNRIGVAWPHKDGKGFTVEVACVPLDGRISLRLITEKVEQTA
jgi:hypothetical protein